MIQIVIGKPGTGKSYHIVRYLVKYLTTLSKKSDIKRHIYTNVSLNLEAFQEYFDRHKLNLEIEDIITILKDDDLIYDEKRLSPGDVRQVRKGNKVEIEISPRSQAFFWNRFEDNALIIIDEIQKYLSSIKEVGECEEQSLVEYFSLHRHKKHDWIFITQSLLSLSLPVRRVSERVTETLNSKALTLPFPLSIPMSDIQTLLLGFGVHNQVYRVREGRLDGTYKIVYDGPIEVVCMKEEFFKLYQTHTLVKDDSVITADSEIPFDLGKGAPWRALLWFAKKHALHLSLKIGVAVFVVLFVKHAFSVLSSKEFLEGDFIGSDAAVERLFSDGNEKPQGRLVSDGIKSNKNDKSVTIDKSRNIKPPIRKVQILKDRAIIDGQDFGVGAVTSQGRVVSISPRKGITYEPEYALYLREFDELDRSRRWLRYVERQAADDRTGTQDF